MLAIFSKLFTLFQSKIAKMPYLHCVEKLQLRMLGCALNLARKCRSAIAEVALRFRN